MKTLQEIEEESLLAIFEKTARPLNSWLSSIKESGFLKHRDIAAFLQKHYELNFQEATLLADVYHNKGKVPHPIERRLIEQTLANHFDQKILFHRLTDFIEVLIPNAYLHHKYPAKIAFSEKAEFAMVVLVKKEIRLYLQLGEIPHNDYLQPIVAAGISPRYHHMIVLKSLADFDPRLSGYLRESLRVACM